MLDVKSPVFSSITFVDKEKPFALKVSNWIIPRLIFWMNVKSLTNDDKSINAFDLKD